MISFQVNEPPDSRNEFFFSILCLTFSFMVSFKEQTFFILMKSSSLLFSLLCIVRFDVVFTDSLRKVKKSFVLFSSRSF